MIVDASAVLAILFAEPDRYVFAAAINGARRTAMSAVNWFEAAIAVDRRGTGEMVAGLGLLLERAGTEIVPFTADQAAIARRAHETFGKGRHKAYLNMGDCAAYALAMTRGEPLLFKGGDFSLTDIEPALKD
jgi:ribonuclease VapC